jgi:hypothetical protein
MWQFLRFRSQIRIQNFLEMLDPDPYSMKMTYIRFNTKWMHISQNMRLIISLTVHYARINNSCKNMIKFVVLFFLTIC